MLKNSTPITQMRKPRGASGGATTLLSPTILKRASTELTVARDALMQARSLFAVIAHAVTAGKMDELDVESIAEIGIEWAGAYAERANGEVAYFAEVPHD